MAGQATVTIKGRQWAVSLATTPFELAQGLGGIPEMPPQTGMLFDLGGEQTVHVTTVPMLFPLDIAFLSSSLAVTEVYPNVAPGYLVTSARPARYFLEVNAGELEGIAAGDLTSVELLSLQQEATLPGWVPAMTSLMGFTLVATLAAGLVRSLNREIPAGTPKALLLQRGKCAFCSSSKSQCEVCERVSPRDYNLLSWVGAPAADYSFAVEPETGERRIDEVLRRLKEGVDGIQQSGSFRQFLLTMSRFHDYSIGNLILIMLQKPNATRVAGFNTWKNLGRWVKKGEKGIAILAPCLPPKETRPGPPEDAEGEGEAEEREEKADGIRPLYFKVVYVFDISQTEGKPLAEFEVPVLTGEANEELFAQVIRLAQSQGLEVSFESRPQQDPDIKGMYFGKSIWVRPEEPRAQQMKTLLHELAHYYSEGVFHLPRRDAETIAESAAFAAGAHSGFDTGLRSFPYVALWAQDKKVLEQNLAAIRRIAARIIDDLERMEATSHEHAQHVIEKIK